MGRFIPCIPVYPSEFGEKGIWFDYYRYCKPYITDEVLQEIFGLAAMRVKNEFVVPNQFGGYELEMSLSTQKQVSDYFAELDDTEENQTIKQGLFDLISNVILLEGENSAGEEFHFRFGMDTTSSFR